MKCPVCGATELVRDTRNIPFSYKGRTTIVSDVTGEFCDACGESLLAPDDAARWMKEIHDFKRGVDATLARAGNRPTK
ncbi:type II toxin-antitoxin system MqsA family antitoxin [Paraburkholderia sp. BL21I4N1]|uniref:type II toxin-antitoxin system MqsA family antitoxin n=1 Tax=Paraburkholderia sp. BL21I4N1 TaxID=1938801 RepID=UPI000CFC0459|nr:type II toxin-antitoxin system MqsA family antitoxin [Paraburkholderia sp. BL21I4N1]PQV52372.1 putative zinc finger/helix-turn-helix YgiT family protein [Paraburkholderia sp. BL21I4N1]